MENTDDDTLWNSCRAEDDPETHQSSRSRPPRLHIIVPSAVSRHSVNDLEPPKARPKEVNRDYYRKD